METHFCMCFNCTGGYIEAGLQPMNPPDLYVLDAAKNGRPFSLVWFHSFKIARDWRSTKAAVRSK